MISSIKILLLFTVFQSHMCDERSLSTEIFENFPSRFEFRFISVGLKIWALMVHPVSSFLIHVLVDLLMCSGSLSRRKVRSQPN